MRPAFSSPKSVFSLSLLLALLMALPELVSSTGWKDRRDIYPAIPLSQGPFQWVQEKIFGAAGEIDVVFMGSSHIWSGVDAPYVQRKLTERLGRTAKVITLAWPWAGLDAEYIVARDLLENHHVQMLVIDDTGGGDHPHLNSSRWFRIGSNSETLDGLPLLPRARLYSSAVLGMPRQLLSFLRPNKLDDHFNGRLNDSVSYASIRQNLGALRVPVIWGAPSFAPFQPHGNAKPDDTLIYSQATRSQFQFAPAPNVYQLHFARKLAQLCKERGTRLVILKMPVFGEDGPIIVSAPELSPDLLGSSVDVVGIPPQLLWSGVNAGEVKKLFVNLVHLNQNGMEMFTPLVTGALLRIYESPVH